MPLVLLLVPALLLQLMGRDTYVVTAIGPREETFPYATINTSDNAYLDVKARGFWCRGQDAYFDVRVLYPNASSYHLLSLTSPYKYHKDAKKCEYGERIREVEHEVFTPLVDFHWWYGSGGHCLLQETC